MFACMYVSSHLLSPIVAGWTNGHCNNNNNNSSSSSNNNKKDVPCLVHVLKSSKKFRGE
jgi:hypothetical protein